MKPTIHPNYHKQALIRCTSCGITYKVGSTAAAVQVEICANCHPFFSGKGSYIDTARRIDKFRKRQALAQPSPRRIGATVGKHRRADDK